MEIRESTVADMTELVNLHAVAFGIEEGPIVSVLVEDLLEDKSAIPFLSLVAVENETIIGHILFTKASITQTTESVSAQILAPLAVHPDAQRRGVGEQLIMAGMSQLRKQGVKLVFVLGYPDYYSRFGFVQAGTHGFEAPYPIPAVHADAWMVQELCSDVLGKVQGRVQCSEVLNHPEHWCE